MIKGTFSFANEVHEVIVDGNNLFFYDMSGMITTLEGIKIDKSGVIKEFPDLKDDEEWRKKAIERLKAHLKTFSDEMSKLNYIKDELVKYGNKPLYFQRAGWRPTKWKEK